MKHSELVRSAILALAVALTGAALDPATASAQDPVAETSNEVSAIPKGTVGLGLLGAELGMAIPALAGLTDWYWYVLFPALGAAGGAVGGWYATDKPGRSNVAVGLLAAGMALLIPTLVLTAWKTSYQPDDEPDSLEHESVAVAEAKERQREHERRRRAGGGVLRRAEGGWLLGAPGLEMKVRQDPKEQLLLGMAPATEVHVPVVTGVF